MSGVLDGVVDFEGFFDSYLIDEPNELVAALLVVVGAGPLASFVSVEGAPCDLSVCSDPHLFACHGLIFPQARVDAVNIFRLVTVLCWWLVGTLVFGVRAGEPVFTCMFMGVGMSYSSPVSHPDICAGRGVFGRGWFFRVNTPRQHLSRRYCRAGHRGIRLTHPWWGWVLLPNCDL